MRSRRPTSRSRRRTWSAAGPSSFAVYELGGWLLAGAVRVGAPKRLFDVEPADVPSVRHYDPSPDGRRFLFLVAEGPASLPSLTVLANWSRRLEH